MRAVETAAHPPPLSVRAAPARKHSNEQTRDLAESVAGFCTLGCGHNQDTLHALIKLAAVLASQPLRMKAAITTT